MSFLSFNQFLFDDDADDADVADDYSDFDVDFDEDYECLSDDEFEVSIECDEYEANDNDIPEGEFLEDLDGFGDFDAPEDSITERDYVDIE